MIRVAIVDDHAMVRSGLMKILKEESDMEVIAEADGHDQLFDSLKAGLPDIVILDISMPAKNGLEILKELKQDYPRIKTLMLSMYTEDRFSIKAIKAGANGYLTKESVVDELVKAVRLVHQGGMFFTPAVAEKVATLLHPKSDKPAHQKLSEREFQILRMIAAGKKVDVIAEELNLRVMTVVACRNCILEKMQLASNAELTNYMRGYNLM